MELIPTLLAVGSHIASALILGIVSYIAHAVRKFAQTFKGLPTRMDRAEGALEDHGKRIIILEGVVSGKR